MEITIQSLHFEASEKLEAFINKKIGRIAKFHDGATLAEVTLKVIKPETNANKEVSLKVFVPGKEFFVQQVCDTFETAIDHCVDTMERQLIKYKETH
jgi:putative sigma-54 modulation protein